MLCIVVSVGLMPDAEGAGAVYDACAVSGKGSAGLSILPLGFNGTRERGTNTMMHPTRSAFYQIKSKI